MKKSTRPTIEAPAFLVIAKTFILGLILAEVFRLAFLSGKGIYLTFQQYGTIGLVVTTIMIIVILATCAGYINIREAYTKTKTIVLSYRIDLLVFLFLGFGLNELISPKLDKFHNYFLNAEPELVILFLVFVMTIMITAIVRNFIGSSTKSNNGIYVSDEEITEENEDQLNTKGDAKSFAESILESGAISGLVYGIDGPWGVGKTSFVNLAQKYWNEHPDKVIVCRFEPLRYANEQDLAERLMREVTAEIQKSVFAPEFKPTASKYSQLIKGKADFSFLGFKLSMQPTHETVDDLLTDIDLVLERVKRRVIIVIDDLDRLDSQTINNVLFATRRTFNLSQATYVLCYDTELLIGNDSNVRSSREFLEKFVTIKFSLFIDSASIRDFLRGGWQKSSEQLTFVPSDTLEKLSSLLEELASILDGELAPNYFPFAGNLRKIKRIINTMVSMKLETNSLKKTDFNKTDLLNLILLHLHFPGIFRRIYVEETGGRQGIFSLRKTDYNSSTFSSSKEFSSLLNEVEPGAKFLLAQLFKYEDLDIGSPGNLDHDTLSSRACFNSQNNRNLEEYLQLIVRFKKPEPQNTYILYKKAFEELQLGIPISEILDGPDFSTEDSHDKFWTFLVNHCYELERKNVDLAIDYLLNNMVNYSSVSSQDRPLRLRSIYSLIRIVDRAGWKQSDDSRQNNTPENVEEIAWRIFGENHFKNNGLLETLCKQERGLLGWYDLLLFRLQCCADRQGQLYEISKALIYNQDKHASNTGQVDQLTILEMRKMSQHIVAKFIDIFILPGRNFFQEVSNMPKESFFGKYKIEGECESIDEQIKREKTLLCSFVIFQLANTKRPTGAGVGCGFYNLTGDADGKGITSIISDYAFNFCFNPNLDQGNIILFLDQCLAHLSNSFFAYGGDEGYVPIKEEISGGLCNGALSRYWAANKEQIVQVAIENKERKVFTHNYTAFYKDDLERVFTVLNEIEIEYNEYSRARVKD